MSKTMSKTPCLCGKPKFKGHQMCPECKEESYDAKKIRDAAARTNCSNTRKLSGLCIKCQKPNDRWAVDKEVALCSSCLTERKTLVATRRELGLCYCGEPRYLEFVRCEAHHKRDRGNLKAKDDLRTLSGLCLYCPDKATTKLHAKGAVSCELCACKSARKGLLRDGPTEVTADELLQLFRAQGDRCAVSGLPLVLGAGAHLDHVVPSTKGGSNNLDNLQWVHAIVNYGKRDYNQGEFIRVCLAVADHQAVLLNY